MSARPNDSGDDVPSPRDLYFVGFTRLHGRDKSGEVRLGFVHVHPHIVMLARLANHFNGSTTSSLRIRKTWGR